MNRASVFIRIALSLLLVLVLVSCIVGGDLSPVLEVLAVALSVRFGFLVSPAGGGPFVPRTAASRAPPR